MKNRHSIIAALLVAVFFMQGCASIFTKNSYPVTISSTPAGAEVEIYNKENRLIFTGQTPANTVLNASNGYMSKEIYILKFRKPGYKDYEYVLESKLEGWFFGNLVLGGIIGMLIVDPLTGSMYKVPETSIIAPLVEDGRSAENGIRIMELDQVPEHLRADLILISE
ncbi:MAG: hypothetical protein LIO85_03555 [Rikenellaceae bacterium]|nr:hypothetical protein [Rikenellaceae bacterium]